MTKADRDELSALRSEVAELRAAIDRLRGALFPQPHPQNYPVWPHHPNTSAAPQPPAFVWHTAPARRGSADQ